jgi:hypothetical protein
MWNAPAERSGDGALLLESAGVSGGFIEVRKAVSRCACHRSPKRWRVKPGISPEGRKYGRKGAQCATVAYS